MLVFFLNTDGTLELKTPEILYQGSANAYDILVISPIAPPSALQCSFTLPDGTVTDYFAMNYVGQYESDENYPVYSWKYTAPFAITEQLGNVYMTVNVVDQRGEIRNATSYSAQIVVEYAAIPDYSDYPEEGQTFQNLYELMTQYVALNSANIEKLFKDFSGAVYDPENEYTVGDYCMFDGYLWKCTEDTTGEFDYDAWTKTNLWAEFLLFKEEAIGHIDTEIHNVADRLEESTASAVSVPYGTDPSVEITYDEDWQEYPAFNFEFSIPEGKGVHGFDDIYTDDEEPYYAKSIWLPDHGHKLDNIKAGEQVIFTYEWLKSRSETIKYLAIAALETNSRGLWGRSAYINSWIETTGPTGKEALVYKPIIINSSVIYAVGDQFYINESAFNRNPEVNETFYFFNHSNGGNSYVEVARTIYHDTSGERNRWHCSVTSRADIRGLQGETGATGPQGPSGQIVGLSAQAVGYDEQPAVTNTGTSTQAVLNFSIPVGRPFQIVKTYNSIAAMEADFSGTSVKTGEFVIIAGSVEHEDNAKLYVKGANAWQFIVDMSGMRGITGPVGPQGATGNGIASITKTSTSGLIDTYTILYTDSTTATFQVNNGNGISQINTSASGRDHTIEISMTNGTSKTFHVYDGEDGQDGDDGAPALTYSGIIPASSESEDEITISDASAFNRTPVSGDTCLFMSSNYYAYVSTFSYASGGYYHFNVNGSVYLRGAQGIQGIQGEQGDKGNPCCLSGKTWSGSLTLMQLASTTDSGIFQYWGIPTGEEVWFLLPATDGYVYQCYGTLTTSTKLDFIPINKTRIKGDTGETGYGTALISYVGTALPAYEGVVQISLEDIESASYSVDDIEKMILWLVVWKYEGKSYYFTGINIGYNPSTDVLTLSVATDPVLLADPSAHVNKDLAGYTAITAPNRATRELATTYVDNGSTASKMTLAAVKQMSTKIVDSDTLAAVDFSKLDIGDIVLLGE